MLRTYLHILDDLGRLQLPEVFDPGRFVAIGAGIQWPTAIGLVSVGLLLCLLGGRRMVFRLVLVPVSVMAALALAPKVAPLVHLSTKTASYLAAVLAGGCALIWPPVLLGLGLGALGALAGGRLAGAKAYWLGFFPGYIIAGVFAAAFARVFAVILTSLAGAAMFVLGLIGLICATRFSGLALSAPVLWSGLAGCVAMAAMVFQLEATPGDDARAKAQAGKQRQRELAAEAKAREERFKAYSKKARRS